MNFAKIKAPSLKELFVRELETMILSGKLKIGEKIPSERVLAEQMLNRFKPVHLDIKISIIVFTNDGFDELFF